jgi:UDP-2,4-diacetamido-2,4,6-trideoxy-beta-L-altropyranose hydrolase
MKVAIRVDASFLIGTGHVMRCLTLADEMRRKDCRVVFVCRKHRGNLIDLIASYNFEIYELGSNTELAEGSRNDEVLSQLPPIESKDWLGVEQFEDAWQTIALLQECMPWDLLIVDHYALDGTWESALRRVAKKIMVIDDLADRRHACDLLLDQNFFQHPEERYSGILPQNCQQLYGPTYALLRSEFRHAKKFTRMRGNGIARILVYFGGNDSNNLTEMALIVLSKTEFQHLFVEVIVGPNNENLDSIKKLVRKRPGTRLGIQPVRFTELMLRADLCIGAGGTTTWERLCLGLPSIVITVAKNQENVIAELNEDQYVYWIGRRETITKDDLHARLLDIIRRLSKRRGVARSPIIVDGYGVLRVVENILPTEIRDIRLRRANHDDMEQFFIWANDPLVREQSFQNKPILWEEHENWFLRKIDSQGTVMLVLETLQGLSVGQVRFDDHGGIARISYSLDALVRGRGWGFKLLKMGIQSISDSGKFCMLQGKVKKTNHASRKLFQKLDFKETEVDERYVYIKQIGI